MDALRAPRERGQKPWEWRRQSPIRPVVFEDTGTMDDSVVHLHLEHRVVRRLLGRFIAQGFVYHDLSRACLAQASDAIPRVVLLGRLCLYGPGAARLHEELIEITARWIDPKLRKGPLAPYAREAESKTLHLLEKALLLKSGHAVTETVQRQLQACAPRDVQELLPHLQRRGEEYAADALKKLRERAEAEAKAMRRQSSRRSKSTLPRRPRPTKRATSASSGCDSTPTSRATKTSGGNSKTTSGTGSSGWPPLKRNSRLSRTASAKCTR